jgi:8-amino-7-oxononanoate synthase
MGRIPVESSTPTTVKVEGKDILAFGGCNYLGLSHEPLVHVAISEALSRFGVSTTASRETTGNTTIHQALEDELARFVGLEAGILSTEGYTANFMALQALAIDHGVAIIDAQAHRSVLHACRAANMQVFEYEHLNPDSASWLLRQYADAGVVLMTDSVFAADGAVAPLEALLNALPARRATLVVDDCHGFCVLGPGGRGAVPAAGLIGRGRASQIVVTTTLAKGLGCYGGVVMGTKRFVDLVQAKAWVYRSSTPVPPPLVAGARRALGLIQQEPSRIDRLRTNIGRMRAVFERLGLPLPPAGIPIFTFYLDDPAAMQRVHAMLLEKGVLAPLIDYPGGPAPWYFRIVVNAAHSETDIDRLDEALKSALKACGFNTRLAPVPAEL